MTTQTAADQKFYPHHFLSTRYGPSGRLTMGMLEDLIAQARAQGATHAAPVRVTDGGIDIVWSD